MQAPIKSETDVLIVGAGPTGLTTAIELQRRGIDCRIIEKDASSIETSRALAIQPRTRQIFEDMGVLDEILTKGIRVKGAIVYRKKTELLRLNMDYLDPPSPYPFLWWLPQNQTEQILVERLEELGGRVEFEHKLVAFGQDDESVTATTMRTNEESHQTESITATWLIGCDGAHSRVRKTLGLPLQGVTQPQELLVADVDIDWERPVDEGSIWFHEAGVLAALPMITESRWRLFADVTPTPPEERPEAARDVLEQIVRERTGDADVTIADAPWTSTVITNQRMVERYRSGRIFLAGDASHVHSPLGGQGMNLGIQDAYNSLGNWRWSPMRRPQMNSWKRTPKSVCPLLKRLYHRLASQERSS